MMMKEDKKMNSIKNKMIVIFGGLNLLFGILTGIVSVLTHGGVTILFQTLISVSFLALTLYAVANISNWICGAVGLLYATIGGFGSGGPAYRG